MTSRKILLIDDDKDDQFFFLRTVKEIHESISCNVADDGLKGMIYLVKNPAPDLIFLDINMPQMNGFDFLRTVKEDQNLKHIPVIMYSTSNQQVDLENAKKLKASAFITKPNNLNILLKLLTKALKLDFSVNELIIINE